MCAKLNNKPAKYNPQAALAVADPSEYGVTLSSRTAKLAIVVNHAPGYNVRITIRAGMYHRWT
jgi:hypothetical protein